MSPMRVLGATVALTAALVLQVSVFPHVVWHGMVPNLVLLVVVGAALVRGARFAMVFGFVAGVLLDMAPPADHVAGRWALALVVVGYVAGRVAPEGRPTATSVVAMVAASSFLGTSVFAFTGILLRDPAVGVPDLLEVIAVGVAWDVLMTPLVLPVVLGMFRRLEPFETARPSPPQGPRPRTAAR